METKTELSPNQTDLAIQEQKATAWGKIGVAVYTTELQLQAMASKAINDLVYPKTIQDIPAAEEALKNFKAKGNEVKELRLAVTSPVKTAFERLMLPEKSFEEPEKKFTQAIIDLKKQNEAANQKEANKQTEIRNLKEAIIKRCAELDAKIKLFVNDMINNYFVFALENSIIIADINGRVKQWSDEGIKKIIERKIDPFKLAPVNITLEEAQVILRENFNINLLDYANAFDSSLKEKFKDYEVAFHNKKDALTRNANEKQSAEKAIADEKLTTEITASIEASAAPLNGAVQVSTKDLKKVFEVEMPESVESVMMLFSAFASNREKCIGKLRVTKWFSFNASQIATALGKLKSEENMFQPQGIIFKEVVKL